jgi:hypothetical protein
MNVYMSLYLAVLFVAFVPGVLVTLPKGGSKYTVLAVHTLLFTVVWHFTHKAVWKLVAEGFQDGMPMNMMNKKEGYQNNMGMMNRKEGYQNNMGMMNRKEGFQGEEKKNMM